MNKFKEAKKIIIEKIVEDLTKGYAEIVKEVNFYATVNEEPVKKHIEANIDHGSIYDVSDFDFSKTVKENVEEYFDKRKFNNHDWWIPWERNEEIYEILETELYEMGIENNWIEETLVKIKWIE